MIESFDSVEDAWAFIETNRIEASERMTASQRALADGKEHWYFTWSGRLPIAGHIMSLDELFATEAKYYDLNLPDDKAEYGWTCRHLREALGRHIVQVRAYSQVEPDGELGGVHVASMIPICQASFDEFIENGFQVTRKTKVLFEDIAIGLSRIRHGL